MKIDIIIPVYSNLKEIRDCVESVLKYSDRALYDLILINDRCPEPEVTEYVNHIKDPNIKVYTNEMNLGFVKTVNIGMKLSEHDVVLLNSDTLVTENLLDNMITAMKKHPEIMCLNPTTNYKFCMGAIPYFRKENEIPDTLSVDDMGVIVEKAGRGKVYEIPEISGFCMYIRREALKSVGYFDADTFGKGYGEETDFCERVKLKGYKLGLVDNSYVYHKGGSSFGSEKLKLKNSHTKIVHQRYKGLVKERLEFIINNPMSDFQRKVLELMYPGDTEAMRKFEMNLNKVKKESKIQLVTEMIFKVIPGGAKIRSGLKRILKR